MMNNKEIISILTDIESSVDVNRLTYRGYCVWPYIRNQIGIYLGNKDRQHLSHITFNKNKYGVLTLVFHIILNYIRNIRSDKRHQQTTKSDIVFLARSSERINLVRGKWYAAHCDSFCDLFEKKYSIRILEFSDNGIFPIPQSRPSFPLDLQFVISRIKWKLKRFFTSENISGFPDLMEHLDEIDAPWPNAEKTIIEGLQRIFVWKRVFAGIVNKIDPKLFFVTCYYCDKAMAAMLACNDLKIPVVEFQHGAIYENTPFLTNWTKVPVQGYAMLPDLFWNWGEASAEMIEKWAGKTIKHKAFVGGNLWMSKWIRDGIQTDDCDKYDIEQVFPANRKHLLLSLLLFPDSFPDFLLDVLRDSPDDWFWHIRQHPSHKFSDEVLNGLLDNRYHINYDFHTASDMPLYLLLKNIDLHITGYSTVAFEAAQFSVPTIFYHPNAREGFKKSLDNNLFCYVEDREQLLSQINKMLSREKNGFNKSSYIETNYDKQIECLESMMDFSRSQKSITYGPNNVEKGS